MTDRPLTPDQEAEAHVLLQRLKGAFEREAVPLSRRMASKEDRHLLGGTEFEVREQGPRLGAQVLETALPARKKKGTQGRGSPGPLVRRLPAASPTAARRWGACGGRCA